MCPPDLASPALRAGALPCPPSGRAFRAPTRRAAPAPTSESNPMPPVAFRASKAAIAFILVTALLDVLSMGIVIPVLPALIEQFPGSKARAGIRSDERRVGKECVSTCKSRWSPDQYEKKK